MTSAYAEAVDRLGWLIDAFEARLADLPHGAVVDKEVARGACQGRRATADEAIAALDAMTELGVLVSAPRGRFVLDLAALEAARPYRTGVRAGLAVGSRAVHRVDLCAALPRGLSVAIEAALREGTQDLRGAPSWILSREHNKTSCWRALFGTPPPSTR